MNTVGNIARAKAMDACVRAVYPPAGSNRVESAIPASCAAVMCMGFSSPNHSVMSATKCMKGLKRIRAIIEPRTLNSTWPIAVRRAARLPLREARMGIMM